MNTNLWEPPKEYEYTFQFTRYVEDHLKDGWEPVPHVAPVPEHSLRDPMYYVFLRRELV